MFINVQVVIEFCEESPEGAYEDLLNKIEVRGQFVGFLIQAPLAKNLPKNCAYYSSFDLSNALL